LIDKRASSSGEQKHNEPVLVLFLYARGLSEFSIVVPVLRELKGLGDGAHGSLRGTCDIFPRILLTLATTDIKRQLNNDRSQLELTVNLPGKSAAPNLSEL
jgi:hypothetical protein